MLLKSADDRRADITALEALRALPGGDDRTRRAIDDEIWSIRLGTKTEADAAYQLDFDLRDNKNWVVIHDLRIELDGRVAQIDHLVISRILEVFVCESKSYTRAASRSMSGANGRPIAIGARSASPLLSSRTAGTSRSLRTRSSAAR
jgi:hypothetical protein